MPLDKSIKKVLVIGSGPIVIGQAAEFDYSGTQACQAIKDEGIDVVLVNSNPATIMTDRGMATNTYIEPLTAEYVEKIIQKERPDSIIAGMGGQTGLNLACELYDKGVFEKYNMRLSVLQFRLSKRVRTVTALSVLWNAQISRLLRLKSLQMLNRVLHLQRKSATLSSFVPLTHLAVQAAVLLKIPNSLKQSFHKVCTFQE